MDQNEHLTSSDYLTSIERQWLQQFGRQAKLPGLAIDADSVSQQINKEVPHLRLVRSA